MQGRTVDLKSQGLLIIRIEMQAYAEAAIFAAVSFTSSIFPDM